MIRRVPPIDSGGARVGAGLLSAPGADGRAGSFSYNAATQAAQPQGGADAPDTNAAPPILSKAGEHFSFAVFVIVLACIGIAVADALVRWFS